MTSSKLPKGWSDYDVCMSDRNRPVKCGDCRWEGHENDLEDDGLWGIRDIYNRIDAGSVVPAGQCPAIHTDSKNGDYECGALVYYDDVEIIYRRKPNILDQIVEATE